MKLQQGEKRPCEACGAALIGCRTKAGKIAPVTEHVQANGNVLVFNLSGLECRTFAGETLAKLREEGVPLRLNHFADCPERERFERERTTDE